MAENADVRPKTIKKVSIDFVISEPAYTFDDVILEDKVKEEILNAISLLEFKDKIFKEWNLTKIVKKPKSLCINFYGESGTGKTMVANAIASHLNLNIIKVNYADIESKFVGETSKNLEKLFEESTQQNAILLFDEADALLSRRITDLSNALDANINQTRSVLLTLLDSFEGMVIFTTNFINNYDTAFMRRIPYHIKFELPNEKVRHAMLTQYLTDTIPHKIDIDKLAQKCEGLSGGDLSNAILVAALKTAREEQDELKQLTLEEVLANTIRNKLENEELKGISKN